MKKALIVLLIALSCGCASRGDIVSATIKDVALNTNSFEYGYVPAEGDEMRQRYEQLKERIQSWGVEVQEDAELAGVFGRTYIGPMGRWIQLGQGLSWNGKFEVLAHEAGHLVQPFTMKDPFVEIFAETVGIRLGLRYDYDFVVRAAVWMSMYKQAIHVVDVYDKEIQWAVDVLSGKKEAPDWLKQSQ